MTVRKCDEELEGESEMTESDWLAEKCQEKRPHLKAVASRILGSNGEADDAVQEAWFRLTRSHVNSVENLGGWLTTVVARVCLAVRPSGEMSPCVTVSVGSLQSSLPVATSNKLSDSILPLGPMRGSPGGS